MTASTPARHLSDLLLPYIRASTALLLLPPLRWLVVVYIGSLFALLLQSFYSLDDFSGLIVHEFTLSTYAELLERSNLRSSPAPFPWRRW